MPLNINAISFYAYSFIRIYKQQKFKRNVWNYVCMCYLKGICIVYNTQDPLNFDITVIHNKLKKKGRNTNKAKYRD